MSLRPATDGFGYAYTPFRIEHRPTWTPPSPQEQLEMLDLLAETGVKAWWTSVATKGSYPFFPSKHLPHRDDAVDYFPWLVEQAHQRGIALFSWEYLTTAPMLGEQHPEWRWKFFEWDGPKIERDRHYVCWNSPYGQKLIDYCVEVCGELKLDGIWFDGAFLHGHGASGTFACCCDFCREKYRNQTGRDLPEKIDLRDPLVREYMEWRYADHTEYWRELSATVRREAPDAIIVYNYFNRLGSNIESGSPLRRMAEDAPQWPDDQPHGAMEAMISAEIGFFPQQTQLLARILRAVNDNYPVELWCYGMDSPSKEGASPDPNPGPTLLHARLCASVGAFASVGCGRENFADYRHLFGALREQIDPIASYVPGKPEKTVGLVVSGCTKDYGYVDDDHPFGQPEKGWAASLGMHNLLVGLHLPVDVLLDNMLSEAFLADYPAVVLPDVRCLSDTAADALADYVRNGGTLLLLGQVGRLDETGAARQRGALDELFGLASQQSEPVCSDLHVAPSLVGSFNERTGVTETNLPPSCRLPGECHLLELQAEDVEVLLTARYHPGSVKRVFGPQGILPPETSRVVETPAVIRRQAGQGTAAWIAPNLAAAYAAHGPHLYSRRLVEALLAGVSRPFTVTAPPNVAVNLIHQQDRSVLHLLNVPQSLLHLGVGFPGFPGVPVPATPADLSPTGPVEVTLAGAFASATSPTHPDSLRCRTESGRLVVALDLLEDHALVVLSP